MELRNIRLDFNVKAKKGLMSVIYGKGIMLSITALFLVILFLFFILFLLPYKMEIGINVFRVFISLVCVFMLFLFSRSLVEILIEEDNIQIKTFKQYRKVLLEAIQLVNIFYFTTWGIALIQLRVGGKSCLYFLWAPKFETERYQLFLRLIDSIKEGSRGRFTVKFRS